MKCPTCTADMDVVAELTYWCPKCGSLKRIVQHGTHRPALVNATKQLMGWWLDAPEEMVTPELLSTQAWRFGVVDCLTRAAEIRMDSPSMLNEKQGDSPDTPSHLS